MKTGMVSLLCGAVLLMSAGAFPAYAQKAKEKEKKKESAAVKPPARPDELKTLERFVGVWSTETTIRVAEWTPKADKQKGVTKYEWIVGNRFLQSRGSSDNGKFHDSEIMTYDPESKAFQSWYFDSMGFTGDSVGQWDEKSQTMTWTGDVGDGGKLINTVKFVNKDTQEWTLVAKAVDDTVLLNMSGKLTRQK